MRLLSVELETARTLRVAPLAAAGAAVFGRCAVPAIGRLDPTVPPAGKLAASPAAQPRPVGWLPARGVRPWSRRGVRFLARGFGLRVLAAILVLQGTLQMHPASALAGSSVDGPQQAASFREPGDLDLAPLPAGTQWEGVPVRPLAPDSGTLRTAATWWIRMFRQYVSPVDGPSCEYSPTCSAYGMQAIEKHGLLLGIPMTAERMMRDHRPHNPDRYPVVERGGDFYYLDPVEANDFWWEGASRGPALVGAGSARTGVEAATQVRPEAAAEQPVQPLPGPGVARGAGSVAGGRPLGAPDAASRAGAASAPGAQLTSEAAVSKVEPVPATGTPLRPDPVGAGTSRGAAVAVTQVEPAPACGSLPRPEPAAPGSNRQCPCAAEGGGWTSGLASDVLPVNARGPLAFALELYQRGHWEEAALEFQRFCFLFPEDPRVPEARLLVGRCREQQGCTADAVREYQRVAREYAESPAGAEALVLAGEALYRVSQFEEAGVVLQRLLEEGRSPGVADAARYRLAWSSLHLHAFVSAREQFAQLQASENSYREPSREMVEGIDGIALLGYRSPFLAGLLSGVLPGAGQAYTGSWKDGLLALLVNGALGFAAYEAFDKEVYVAGGLAAAVGLTFYLGNVYGAVNSAQRANQEGLAAHLRPYQDRLEWFSPAGGR